MGKQKQIGLENYLKFDSVKFLTKQLPARTLKMPKSKQSSSRLLHRLQPSPMNLWENKSK